MIYGIKFWFFLKSKFQSTTLIFYYKYDKINIVNSDKEIKRILKGEEK